VSPEVRYRITSGVQDAVILGSGFESACEAIGINPRRLQRWRQSPSDGRAGGLRNPGQKLSEAEKDEIVEAFHKPEFIDLPIRPAWVKMLDQGQYLCSQASVFRVLDERQAKARLTVRRARPQRRPPLLEAKAANEVLTWDITYLDSPIRGAYFYLYSVQDLFSRKIVGWSVEAKEDGKLARDLFSRILSEQIQNPQGIRVHADNGSPMRSKCLSDLFERLEVRCTHGRPHVSDDNAYIELVFGAERTRLVSRVLQGHPTGPGLCGIPGGVVQRPAHALAAGLSHARPDVQGPGRADPAPPQRGDRESKGRKAPALRITTAAAARAGIRPPHLPRGHFLQLNHRRHFA